MFLLSFENGLLYVTYKNVINFWLAKNGRFYCVLPYKTAIGSSWGGGGDHIYIYIYILYYPSNWIPQKNAKAFLRVLRRYLQYSACINAYSAKFNLPTLANWLVVNRKNRRRQYLLVYQISHLFFGTLRPASTHFVLQKKSLGRRPLRDDRHPCWNRRAYTAERRCEGFPKRFQPGCYFTL